MPLYFCILICCVFSSNALQKLLLVTDNHARSAETHPCDKRFSIRDPVLLYHVAADESAGSAEASPTVYRNSSLLLVAHLDELLNDVIRGTGTIRKLHIKNFDPLSIKDSLVIEKLV